MKVFDQKNFPSTIQFAGICILKDKQINSYFKEMENPRHDAWEPERHSKPGEAKKKRQGLFRYMKEIVLELGRKTTAEAVDAEGMGEYLPDEECSDSGPEKYEDISDVTKGMDLTISPLRNGQKGFEVMPEGEGHDAAEETGISGEEDFEEDELSRTEKGDGYGTGAGSGPGTNGNGIKAIDGKEPSNGKEARVTKRIEVHTMSVRLMLFDAKNNRYRLNFIPEQTVGNGYLQLKLSGEQSNLAVDVSQAVDCVTKEPLISKGSIIYLRDITVLKKMSIEFNINYSTFPADIFK